MAKKISRSVKTRITKMFNKGKTIDEIKAAVLPDFPKITADRINTLIKKKMVAECDELWSLAVKIKGGNKCAIGSQELSDSEGRLESHHLIGRDSKLFRWDTTNGICLGSYYHTFGRDISAHGSTDVTQRFAEWMIEHRPEQWSWFLKNKDRKEYIKLTMDDLRDISQGLKQEIIDLRKELRC